MSPRHHPAEVVLAGYASGALADGPSLVVSAHLEHCPACRGQARLLEQVGGALLAEEPEAAMADDALALALARIERPEPARAAAPVPAPPAGLRLPKALARRGLGPRRWVGPGIWVAPVPSRRPEGWRTYMLRVPRGVAVPHHGHNGPEFTVVLRGAFCDGEDLFRAGDFGESGEGLEHHPEVEGDDACVCLISGHNGVRASGVLRLIQPFLGV